MTPLLPTTQLPKELEPPLEAALNALSHGNIVRRIGKRDHHVWQDDPTEIVDRLGWLSISDAMGEKIEALEVFAAEVQDAGYRDSVVLGMGGSSLGAEALRHTFGNSSGSLGGRTGQPLTSSEIFRLSVLDSTLPAQIQAVDAAIDPAKTLFLISSKSGSTIEPNALYAYFRQRVSASEREAAGGNFVAITDPGTVLEKLAAADGFRATFLNPPDLGGRYSVLSYFGLVPAALLGVDLRRLLASADGMREACAAPDPQNNPGAWLGAFMAALARQGRNKLTLLASPTIASFALWAEQLLAESLGKAGRGIIPIAQEPALFPHHYAADRFFIYLRLEGDANAELDAQVAALANAGHPMAQLTLSNPYDLGAEFYRWQFATAIAASLLAVHPFDQPDVQGAKEMTDRMLARYRSAESLPPPKAPVAALAVDSVREWLAAAQPGDYLAIMAYLPDTPALADALSSLRRQVTERYGIATTAGFGPRYLHSTGQLHKGGPDSGRFLQLTANHQPDLAIPGQPYTFGLLADAQAAGDLKMLRNLGRPVIRMTLDDDHPAGLQRLADAL